MTTPGPEEPLPLIEDLEPPAQEVVSLLDTAVQLHKTGRLGEVDRLCSQVLDLSPDNPDALHLSAVVAFQSGRFIDAISLIDRAIARMPDHSDAYNDRGNVLRALGRPDDALDAYRQGIALAPKCPVTWLNLGNALRDLGRHEEALRAYGEALARQPEFAQAQLNQGLVLQELGRPAEALAAFEAATRSQPDFAEAHDHQGSALLAAGRLDPAIESYRRAVALRPDFTGAYCNLGAALWHAGRYHEAADALQAALALDPNRPEAHNHMGDVCKSLGYLDQAYSAYRRALTARPDYPEAHFNLGVLLGELGRRKEALASYRAALSFRPDFAAAHANLGAELMKLDRPAEAITAFRRALEIRPEAPEAWYQLGNALQEERRSREAVAAYNRALALAPQYSEAYLGRGLALLAAGDYAEGWEGYEWRTRVQGCLRERSLPWPRWDGAPLGGRTILIHAERGLGDTLQFARYLPLVAAKGGRVVLECQPGLTRLLEALPSVAQVVPQGAPLPEVDCHIPLPSLPRLFGTRLDSIPNHTPFLPTQTWSNRVPLLPGDEGVRVGLVWSGSETASPRRSIPLATLAPLFDVPGITWYSLQLGAAAGQVLHVPEARGMHNLGPLIRDFADTAALVGQLDLVITVDTSVAHLAGGLGANLWLMLRAAPDWRWVSDGGDSPWYPDARLFRQPRPGDWSAVVAEVRANLVAVLSGTD